MTATRRPIAATGDEMWVVAALAGLSGMGPKRLRAVLAQYSVHEAWRAIEAGRLHLGDQGRGPFGGRLPALLEAWSVECRQRTPERLADRCRALGIDAVPYGAAAYPKRLLTDVEPPVLVFTQGDPGAADGPSVAIVGTRRATAYGTRVAAELGRDLAAEGVAVISGLAAGIDAAAHRGALEAAGDDGRPVGVVGSGLDVVYPRRNARLWRAVADRGLLLSEAPPGTVPEAWRFPARNRLIAGLAQVLVVVESPAAGGSMITVDEAARRQVAVMAVPGSIHSPASAGTNSLLFDGCAPVRNVDDVLGLLDRPLSRRTRPVGTSTECRAHTAEQRAVLDALGWEAGLLDDVVLRSGLSLATVIRLVEELVASGDLVRDSGFLRRVSVPVIEVGRR